MPALVSTALPERASPGRAGSAGLRGHKLQAVVRMPQWGDIAHFTRRVILYF